MSSHERNASLAEAVLEYWFGTEPFDHPTYLRRGALWFNGSPTVDLEITERFAERRGPSPTTRWRASGACVRWRRASIASWGSWSARSSTCRSSTRSRSTTSGAAWRCSSRSWRRRRPSTGSTRTPPTSLAVEEIVEILARSLRGPG